MPGRCASVLGPMGNGGELGRRRRGEDHPADRFDAGGARREALLDIASGQAGIAVGTHALLSEGVFFADLGLIVVDEQHRFGVEQRNALRDKHPGQPAARAGDDRDADPAHGGDDGVRRPGDLHADRAAAGPVADRHHRGAGGGRPGWLERAWRRVREEVAAGHQVYVVCPKIGDERTAPSREVGKRRRPTPDGPEARYRPADDERPGAAAGRAGRRRQLAAGPLAGLRLAVLHGRLPSDGQGRGDALVRRRAGRRAGRHHRHRGRCRRAERHDDGRPGRRAVRHVAAAPAARPGRPRPAPGVCLLVTESPGELGRRLAAVAATNDGFVLAEADLNCAGRAMCWAPARPGRSSELKQLSLIRDRELIEQARSDAQLLVTQDPDLARYPGLAGMADSIIDETGQEFLTKG